MATAESSTSGGSNGGPTRLLLTNLHPSVSTSHLRTHLERCPSPSNAAGALTDLKVLSRPDGTSRCIAFAGFKRHSDAERVREWLDGTWVAGERGGARVKADWAKEISDNPRPSKRSRRNDDGVASLTSANTAPLGGSNNNNPQKKNKGDRFADFLAVMNPAKSVQAESSSMNEDVQALLAPAGEGTKTDQKTTKKNKKGGDDAAAALPAAAVEPTPESDGAAQDEELTDAEYLARRMKRKLSEVDDDDEGVLQEAADDGVAAADAPEFEQDAEDGGKPEEIDAAAEEKDSAWARTQETLLETGRLFLRNLPFTTTSDELGELCSTFGPVDQVHIPIDTKTNQAKGLAYVTFVQPADAVTAFKALDGTTFQGRLLHILPAMGRAPKSANGSNDPKSLKQERLEERKQNAGQAFSWGTLYLNADAAISAVADRLGISKSALLDPSASDPAVKVALAEAHTLAETKRYFESQDVNLDAFSRPGPRSSTCILVKNLPYATTASSLQTLFAPHGTISRLLVPPSGTIAIVEMADKDSAQKAWRALVYKQFGGSVLYLEKAPAAIWSSSPAKADKSKKDDAAVLPVVAAKKGAAVATSSSAGSESDAAPGATLFLKNLSFATTTPRLRAAFDHLDGFVFARVQTKPDPKRQGETLSMGFGFAGFKTPAQAQRAKEAQAGMVLDGHEIEINFAKRDTDKVGGRGGNTTTAAAGKESSTKLLVKNVPFEATRNDLRQLFGAYGQLKSVRLPRKMDNKTRGFAFLEFASRRDAESAFEALEHTHLLGRHLVLQWTGTEDGVGEGSGPTDARGKATVDFSGQTRRSKTKFTI
ncbi:Multiple RNA-binding domain-containing protein 1 [Rhodotorula mucilaginosa]|uniref:Multiple RNA-binding domain-containing protein 1 n=1 Tax=Rhodotorula mucilaginosa TaxID=5537 RepID=A0A9P7B8J9_RHOMI|nr:Multiple RNA-binding domain-containing protein 1 [Rhodotorula mucilaginosa]